METIHEDKVKCKKIHKCLITQSRSCRPINIAWLNTKWKHIKGRYEIMYLFITYS